MKARRKIKKVTKAWAIQNPNGTFAGAYTHGHLFVCGAFLLKRSAKAYAVALGVPEHPIVRVTITVSK